MASNQISATEPPSSAGTTRKYHDTDSAYLLPNDAIEQDRLDAQAEAIVEMLDGKPFLGLDSLPASVKTVVDVGCGTGVATLQLANLLPQAHVYGLDLSPVPEAKTPENVSWVLGNVLDPNATTKEILAPDSVDYVFDRMLILGINDWDRYVKTVAQALRPGGIFEAQDIDLTFYRTGTNQPLSDEWEFMNLMRAAAAKSGLCMRAGSKAKERMEDEGLEVISTQTYEFSFVPTEKVPKSMAVGRYARAKLLPQLSELLRKMLTPLGVEGEKLKRMQDDLQRDCTSEEGIHMKYTVTIGRKPLVS